MAADTIAPDNRASRANAVSIRQTQCLQRTLKQFQIGSSSCLVELSEHANG